MSDALLYSPSRLGVLAVRTKAAIDDLDCVSSDDPMAQVAIATVRAVSFKLSTTWMPWFTRALGDRSALDWNSGGPTVLNGLAQNFNQIDANGDGTLSWQEIEAGAKSEDAAVATACAAGESRAATSAPRSLTLSAGALAAALRTGDWNTDETLPAEWPMVDDGEYARVDAEDLNSAVGAGYGDALVYLTLEQVQSEITNSLGSAVAPEPLDRYGTASDPLGDPEAVLIYVPGNVANAAQLGIPITIAQVVPAGSAREARENLTTAEDRLVHAGAEDIILLGENGQYDGHPNAPGAEWATSGSFDGDGILEGALITYRLVEPGVYEARVYWERDEDMPSQNDVYAVAAITEEPVMDPITGNIINTGNNVMLNIINRNNPHGGPWR